MKKLLLLFAVILMIKSIHGQTIDTLYYHYNESFSSAAEYDIYRVIEKQDSKIYLVKEYYKGDSLRSTFTYKSLKELEADCEKLPKLIKRNKLVKDGVEYTYRQDTILDGETRYELGEVTYGPVRYLYGDTLYFNVDQMPRFNNKDISSFRLFVQENLVFPEEAETINISGRVYVQFVVNKEGKVAHARVIRGVDPLLDKEALRVINISPDWTPGMEKGKPVSVLFVMPIVFIL